MTTPTSTAAIIWTGTGNAASPVVTVYYPISGYGLVFPNGQTLLPGSALSTFGEQVSLEPNGEGLVIGEGWTTQIQPPAPVATSVSSTDTSTTATSSILISTSVSASISSVSGKSISSASSTISSTSTSAPSLSSTNVHSHKSTVSAGAAIGIGIGCAIAGAAIVALLFWFFKRNSKDQHHARDSEAGASVPHQDKQPVVNVQPLDNANLTTRTVENNLPQPLEDNAIAGEISKISNLIKNHVQSYYHSARVGAGTVDLDALQALADGLSTSIETLNAMLTNPATREAALRLCIAWVIVPRIQFGGDPRITFLPPEAANCINSMTSLDSKPQVRTAFLSKWRTLTAELMQTTYGRNAFSANDSRNQNILRAVEVLDTVLHPYADARMDNNERRRNLEEILKRAASFAFMLFSQPSSWKLEWENPHGLEPNTLVIFPALVQVVDEMGRSLSPPRAFSEVVVRQIDG